MSAFSDAYENKYVDWFFRAQALGLNGSTAGAGSGPATLYVGLFNAAGSDGAPGTEVSTSGTSYARVPITSALANWAGTQGAGSTAVSSGSSGTTSNNNPVQFPGGSAVPAAWGQVVEFGVFDSATGGTEVFRAALSQAKTINAGDPAPYFAAGTLTLQVDN
ncbi:hypothetical protein [Massilia sp. 9096]|uniref:phage tail fiber protein n=1 Tax=Massilia sp. 9096 TaxID=1500894 RepID=UPI00056B4961|nr:hypothetical protein [Massilia sp. 9096]